MDRKEVEDKIARMFYEIVKVARDYCPEDRYLNCVILENLYKENEDLIMINNEYFVHKDRGVIHGAYRVKGGEIIDRSIRKDY